MPSEIWGQRPPRPAQDYDITWSPEYGCYIIDWQCPTCGTENSIVCMQVYGWFLTCDACRYDVPLEDIVRSEDLDYFE